MLKDMEQTNKTSTTTTVATTTQDSIQEQHEVMTAKELGLMLRPHPFTVRLSAAAKKIPGRQVGNRWRFSRTRINEWLKAA